MTESNSGWGKKVSRRSFLGSVAVAAVTVLAGPGVAACLPKAEAKPVQKKDVVSFAPNVIVSPEAYQQATEEEKRMLDEHEEISRQLQQDLINPNILEQYPPVPNMIQPEDLRVFRTMGQRTDSLEPSHTISTGSSRGFTIRFKNTFHRVKGNMQITAREVMFALNQGYRQFPHFPGLDKLFRDQYRRQRSEPYSEDEVKTAVGGILNLDWLHLQKRLNWRGVIEKGNKEPSLVAEGITPTDERYELTVAPSPERFSNDRYVTLRISSST